MLEETVAFERTINKIQYALAFMIIRDASRKTRGRPTPAINIKVLGILKECI